MHQDMLGSSLIFTPARNERDKLGMILESILGDPAQVHPTNRECLASSFSFLDIKGMALTTEQSAPPLSLLLELVGELNHVKICPRGVRSVNACIGIVQKAVAQPQVLVERNAGAQG